MNKITRRHFFKQSALLGAGTFFLPRFSIAQSGIPASSRVNIALVGCGWMSKGVLSDPIPPVVLCDVDARAIAAAKQKFPHLASTPAFSDYREMFDKMGKDIDLVVVSTPDHTHFAVTMEAMQRGKHVFTQKPLTHNIWEARTLARAAKKYNVKTVMGNQGHTYDGIRTMREWYEAGLLGQVGRVDAWFPGPAWGTGEKAWFTKPSNFPPLQEPIPEGLDWDLWVGPAPATPYNPVYTPKTWRGFWQFGGGMIGDWFCHISDGPVWILDLYEPTVVEAVKIDGPNPGMCPDGSIVRMDFPARGEKVPCSFWWYDGKNRPTDPSDWSWGSKDNPDGQSKPPISGSYWEGTKGMFYLDERSNNPRMTSRQKTIDLKASGTLPPEKYPRVKDGPVQEIIRAIKGEGPDPGSDFTYAARLTEVALLGAIAQRCGGRIEWDAANMKITNRPELNAIVKEPVRKGWEYGEDLWKA